MGRNIYKKKIIKLFISFIAHDFGAYNPIWKWSELPKPLDESYYLIEFKLLEWQKKGQIRIFEKNGERMLEIISIPEE